ncbi:MAG: hypothetical protein HUJ72_12965 [Blautia sp.]|nr:hypothetical protein [Blautia sp.]
MRKRIVSLITVFAIIVLALSGSVLSLAESGIEQSNSAVQENVENVEEDSFMEDFISDIPSVPAENTESESSGHDDAFSDTGAYEQGAESYESEEDPEYTYSEDDSNYIDTEIQEPAEVENFDDEEVYTPEDEEPGTNRAEEVPDSVEILTINEENVDQFLAEDEESMELLDEMEDGETIAFAALDEPYLPEEQQISTFAARSSEDEIALFAVSPNQYKFQTGQRIYCDEVWTKANDVSGNGTRVATSYRTITYINYNGDEKKSVIYCLNASKADPPSGTIEDETMVAITNANLKKILYYGYGGPGDITETFDPTCSHIDWSKDENRFIFTHLALSKIYSGDVGKATTAEVEHVGLNKFINKLTSMDLPSHTSTKLKSTNKSNETVTTDNLQTNLILYTKKPSSHTYIWDDYNNGFYVTRVIEVVDKSLDSNGISISRKSTDNWQLLYWTSEEDYQSRGISNPRVGGKEDTVKLKAGARFRVIFPATSLKDKSATFQMLAKPISFILMDTSKQFNGDLQDFGACVFQGEPGEVKLTMYVQPQGSLLLTKKDSKTGSLIKGAEYELRAAENLRSGGYQVYAANTVIAKGTTNDKGIIRFNALIPGKYTVKEKTAPDGYKLDTKTYNVTVTANKTDSNAAEKEVLIQEEPAPDDITAKLTITKKIQQNEIIWAHGNPCFQFLVAGTDTNGKERSYSLTLEFEQGSYSVDADGWAALSGTITNMPAGKYEVNELPTLRYYLSSIQKDSGNVTISNKNSPQFGLNPSSIASANVILNQESPQAKLTFYNKKQRFDDYSHTSHVRNEIPIGTN